MKTRIVFTKIHEDDYFRSLNDREQCFFFFLLTNERVNLSGMYHCPDWYVLGVKPHWNQKSLNDMKLKFQTDGKFAFIDGWVKIINYPKYNQYAGSKLDKALESELATIPDKVKEYDIDTLSMEYRYPIDTTNNHKSIIINNKSITINHKSDEIYKNIIQHYNQTFEKQTKSYTSWKTNCDTHLKSYSLEDIKQAITNWKDNADKFWAKEPSLDLLFRTKNKNGQPCDYIDQLLNLKSARKLEADPLAGLVKKGNYVGN